jgi:hypothetical protein
MQHHQQSNPQHKHAQWNQEVTVGSNRLYVFGQTHNNLQLILSILSVQIMLSPTRRPARESSAFELQ